MSQAGRVPTPVTCGSSASTACPELSVLIPVYNEEHTIDDLIARVRAAAYRKQIIIVDDGSSDGTAACLARYAELDGVEILTHTTNRGKGAAIRTALARARGRCTIVQDADLEYDPRDYPRLVEPILRGETPVVFGSRYLNRDNALPITRYWLGIKVLNTLVGVLFGGRLTDEATCYKAFDTELLKSLDLKCRRFEFCPEVTAKTLVGGFKIREVPIRYRYRTVAQGKKIRWHDGVQAVLCLVRHRLGLAARSRTSR